MSDRTPISKRVRFEVFKRDGFQCQYCGASPPPESIDPRVMGAIFNRSDWEAVEFVNSHRRTCHKRPIRRFVPRLED